MLNGVETVDQYLTKSLAVLKNSSIPSPRLDSLLLLEHVVEIDRATILAHPEMKLSTSQLARLEKLLTKRISHIPIAQLVHFGYFFGRKFYLNQHVLQPRPETESMVEMLLELIKEHKKSTKDQSQKQAITICDVGTGSGAIGITAKLEVPESRVVLIDKSTRAMKVAKINDVFYSTDCELIVNDLLSGISNPGQFLLCNLPYVPDRFHINLEAGQEPKMAIFGGKDGLNLYRRLFKQIQKIQKKPLYILCESLPFQHDALIGIANSSNYDLCMSRDLILVFRQK